MIFPVCIPTLAVSGLKLFYFLGFGLCLRVLHFAMSSYAFHITSSCAFHCAYMFVSCIRAFSPLSVLQSGTPMSPGVPFCISLCAGVKLSRNGPRFAKRPWYSTGRPPVKFRAIWRSFDTPTVNRVTVKALFGLQPNTPSKVAQNPSNS